MTTQALNLISIQSMIPISAKCFVFQQHSAFTFKGGLQSFIFFFSKGLLKHIPFEMPKTQLQLEMASVPGGSVPELVYHGFLPYLLFKLLCKWFNIGTIAFVLFCPLTYGIAQCILLDLQYRERQ